ncbi:ABC transporter permease [Niallia sp. FSL W8-0635]|uniref:ABC transporter permease n=1 Tax=Niallia sp. FSL W8-0635 TaxID=2975337 RepID=UPI0003329910|nr:oligopeptide ABC transporter permease [Niallia nealsonii AAU1]HEO8418178.1 ABC transporter permease [Yersinia enterocolitica]
MLNYTIKRLLEAIPIWVAITLIVFVLMNIIPGDPVAQLMDARSGALDENVMKQIREQWGLNDPLPLQYLHFLQGVVQGDFGTSYQSRSSVTELLIERIPVTLQITVLGLIIAIVIGITVGTIGALKRGSWIDSFVSSFSVSGVSLPSFFLGLILMYLFAVKFRLLPATGYVAGDIRYLILPSLTLALAVSGVIARITRSAMIDILRMDYMTTAISKGMSSGRIIVLHALKNAMPPILTIIGVQMGLLLSGAVITETIYGLPGVGRLMIDAILQRDLPIVQGCVVFVATVFLLVNLLTDIGCRLIDPRIKVES